MFKLVVLSAFIAVAAAGYIASPLTYTVAENRGYAKVGAIVQNIPTAVSHQSSTVVHNKAARITPLIAPVVQKTILTAGSPGSIVYSAPILRKSYVGSPLVYSSPVLSNVVSAPANVKYIEPVRPVKYISLPLSYSAAGVHAW